MNSPRCNDKVIDALHKLNLEGQKTVEEIEALLHERMGLKRHLAITMVVGPRDWNDPHGRPMISIGNVKAETGAVMFMTAAEKLAASQIAAIPPVVKTDGEGKKKLDGE